MIISFTILAPGLAIAGLACVAIPILIHLLSRRTRPPIPWAAMQFVMEAWQARRRRLRIQQIILMAIRCLIPVILGLALAQPFISNVGILSGGGNSLHLIIDNSMTANLALDDGRTALQHHQELAIDRIRSMEPGSEISVTTTAGAQNGRLLLPGKDHDRSISIINSIEIEPSPVDLGSRLRDVGDYVAQDPGRHHEVLLISEFREGTGQVDESLPPAIFADDSVRLTFTQPSQRSVNQVRIIDANPLRRIILKEGGVENLASQSLVRLARDGIILPATTTELIMMTDSGDRLVRPVEWASGQRELVVDVALPVNGRDSLNAFNSILVSSGNQTLSQNHHLAIEVQDQLRVLLLDREVGSGDSSLDRDSGLWIRRALKPIDSLPIEIRTIDPAAFMKADVLETDAIFILRPDLLAEEEWNTLYQFRVDGGTVVVTPPGDRDVHSWLKTMVETQGLSWATVPEHLEYSSPVSLIPGSRENSVLQVLGSELELLLEPVVINRMIKVDPGSDSDVALRSADGHPLLITHSKQGQGTFTFLTTAPRLDWTSLPAKPLMVPLVQEMVRGGLNLSRQNQTVTVGDENWRDAITFSSGELVHDDGHSLFIDTDDRWSTINVPGIWSLVGGQGSHSAVIVANVDPSVGDADVQSLDAVDRWLGKTGSWSPLDQTGTVTASTSGLVWLLLSIALGFLVLESVLSHLFSARSTLPEMQLSDHPE